MRSNPWRQLTASSGRGLFAAAALMLAGGALALIALWEGGGQHARRQPSPRVAYSPPALRGNGLIAFTAFRPGFDLENALGGQLADMYVFTMKPDGSSIRQVTSGPGLDLHPAWSPDGRRIAFIRRDRRVDTQNLFVLDASGSGLRQVTFCRFAGCVRGASWSPTGDQLAYARGTDVYVIRPDGTDNHLIFRCDCRVGETAWSPDGRWIAFDGARDEHRRIPGFVFVIRPDGTKFRQIDRCDSDECNAGARDGRPVWSPDGRWVTFERESDIWLVRPDGSGLQSLTHCPRGRIDICRFLHPVWSPDGRLLLFERGRDVYLMRADGTRPRLLRKDAYLGSWQAVPVSP